MEPLFPKWTNKLPLILGIGIPLFIALLIFFIWYYFSPKYLAVGYQPNQPIPFNHKVHAGQLGLDCRYCHTTVEKASYAAIPAASTCMGCHNKVLLNSPRLQLLRENYKNNTPIPWVHVYSLPRHSHFES